MRRSPAESVRLDSAYFRKFYRDRKTRVVTRGEMQARAALIAAILKQV